MNTLVSLPGACTSLDDVAARELAGSIAAGDVDGDLEVRLTLPDDALDARIDGTLREAFVEVLLAMGAGPVEREALTALLKLEAAAANLLDMGAVNKIAQLGLITRDGNHVTITPQGMPLLAERTTNLPLTP